MEGRCVRFHPCRFFLKRMNMITAKIHLAKNRFTTFCGKKKRSLKKNGILIAEANKGVSCKSCRKGFNSRETIIKKILEKSTI